MPTFLKLLSVEVFTLVKILYTEKGLFRPAYMIPDVTSSSVSSTPSVASACFQPSRTRSTFRRASPRIIAASGTSSRRMAARFLPMPYRIWELKLTMTFSPMLTWLMGMKLPKMP